MKVLILVHGFPPTHVGGAERRAARTARYLVQRGLEVMVLAIEKLVDADEPTTWSDTTEHGVRILRIGLAADRSSDAFRTSFDNPQTATMTERAIADYAPDVVHLFSGYLMSASAVRVAIRKRIPVIVSLTDYWWLCHRITLIDAREGRCSGPSSVGCARCQAETRRRFRIPSQLAPSMADRFWDMADHHERLGTMLGSPAQAERQQTLVSLLNECSLLISPSRYLADFHIRFGVDPNLIRVQRQGVDVDRCPMRTPSRALRFGCLGQVKPHKGVDLLLDAWRKLDRKGWRYLNIYGSAAGEPGYGAKIREMVDELDDVSWHGAYRGDEVWDILKDLDVLVIPSRWVENSPNSILEAQAMGLPVIATRLGAMPELVIDGQNGLTFGADDSEDLSRCIQRLLDHPRLVDQLRSKPIAFKSVNAEIDQLCHAYAEVTGTVPHPVRKAALVASSEFSGGLRHTIEATPIDR